MRTSFYADPGMFGNARQIIADAQHAAYVTLLQRHDWSYEMSEDPQRYDQGRAERMELQMVRREIDPDYSVWNEHAPTLHRMEAKV